MPALHPSCYLNQNWKIPLHPPSSAPSVFYIRFTCNGFIPNLTGFYYRLNVKFGTNELFSSEAFSSISTPDMAGPFLNPSTLSEAYAYLYYKSSDTNFNTRTLFSHFYDLNINPANLLSTAIIGIVYLIDKLFITDSGNNRLVQFSASDLSFINSFGSSGSGNDQFSNPQGIYCDGTYLYITDTGNHRIVKRLAEDYSYVSQVGSYGTGNDQFKSPSGIWGDDTHIYITDTENHRIVKRLASTLAYDSKIGSYGTGNDQFKSPSGIWGDDTHIYITDTNNYRVVKRLVSTLAYNSKIGSYGTGNNQFKSPSGIWGDDTHIYITDTNNYRVVKRLVSTLAYVLKYGSQGTDISRLTLPRGICGSGNTLFLLDSGNHRIVTKSSSTLQSIIRSNDWDYATVYKSAIGSCDYIDNYLYKITVFNYINTSDCNLFVNRVLWKKNIQNLFEQEPSYEEIDGIIYPVYSINFNELYRLQYSRVVKSNPTINPESPPQPVLTPICNSSGWNFLSPYTQVSQLDSAAVVFATSGQTCQVNETDPYDVWPWGYSYSGYYALYSYIDFISEISSSAKQVILSDQSGNSPAFESFSVHKHRLYPYFQVYEYWGDLFCESINMTINDLEIHTYEMVLTSHSTFCNE